MIERRIKICANSSYGGVFVYNLSSQLLEQYPFEVTAIQKGRGTYICTTSEGGKIIIGSFRGSKGRVEAIEHVLLRLKENGIEADEIIHTREGEILAQEVDETWYYARKYMEGRECETRSRDDVLAADSIMTWRYSGTTESLKRCAIIFMESIKRMSLK